MDKEQLKEGVKYDADKERFDLISSNALMWLARVYTYGAHKYADRNMEKGMKWGRIFAACMRHLWKFWWGEELDEESGLPHLGHAMWCCACLLDYSMYHKEFDDRSPYYKKSEDKADE